jgi:cytochrome c oxidase cbb3-type subunit 3
MRRWLLPLILVAACHREQREARPIATETGRFEPAVTASLTAGISANGPVAMDPYRGNAYAMGEGKRLYEAFNCVGCHAHGGGAIGPALMDDRWIYGSEPANIFSTIVEGRPNGMPSFRRRLADYQVWQLVAYVRSLSGLAPIDAAPGRDDHMAVRPPESRTPASPATRQEALELQ